VGSNPLQKNFSTQRENRGKTEGKQRENRGKTEGKQRETQRETQRHRDHRDP
jgi:hypothetical protein